MWSDVIFSIDTSFLAEMKCNKHSRDQTSDNLYLRYDTTKIAIA